MGAPVFAVSSLTADALLPCVQGSGRMLPAAAYLDDAILAWEQTNLFGAGWVCLGRASSLSAPGARRAFALGGASVVVMRGKDHVLRGFHNVCRHRGHELMQCGDEATGAFLRCPYHAWVYDTTGQLHGVPPEHQPDVPDTSLFPLVPVRIHEWHGFVFANLSGDAPELDEYLQGLDQLVDEYDLASLGVGASHDYQLAANWKLLAENYHECFHCDSIHPELCVVSDPESGVSMSSSGSWLAGTMWLRDSVETMSLDGKSHGSRLPGLTPARARDVVYVHVLPNLLISLHPDYVMTHRLQPLAAGRTLVECQWLFPLAAFERPDFDPSYAADFWDLTNRQDWAACESVQRGVASPGFRPGPLSTHSEYVVKSFIQLIADGYAGGGLSNQPWALSAPLTGDAAASRS